VQHRDKSTDLARRDPAPGRDAQCVTLMNLSSQRVRSIRKQLGAHEFAVQGAPR